MEEDDVDVQSFTVPTITDDPRFLLNYCRKTGILTPEGQCPEKFEFKEVLFGSIPANRSHFSNIVALTVLPQAGTNQPDSLCSGSLISKRLILTARHCLEWRNAKNNLGQNVLIKWRIDEVVFGLNEDSVEDPNQVRISVQDCFDFGKTTPMSCSQSYSAGNDRDIVVVRLASDAPTFPVRLAPSEWVNKATELTAVGFGFTEADASGKRELGKKFWVNIPMVSNSCSGTTAATTDVDKYSCKAGIELVAGRGSHDSNPEADTCGGDSGGPVFLATVNPLDASTIPDAAWPYDFFLAGVTSRAITLKGISPAWPNCGDGGIYVRSDGDVQSWLVKLAKKTKEEVFIGSRH